MDTFAPLLEGESIGLSLPSEKGEGMAFIKDKTGSAQTAANASAVVVAAFADSFKNFDAAVDAFNDLRAQVFEDLSAVVDSDNEKFAAEDGGGKSNGSSKSSNRSSKGSGSRGSKTRSGGKSRGGGGGGSITLDDALGMELNFGAFEGETLGDVLKLTSDECEDDYGYGDGEREGADYISWLASDKNQNEYVQRRARLIADDEGIDY